LNALIFQENRAGENMNITIKVGPVKLKAILHDTPTAKKIGEILPLTSRFNTWGDEIYFAIPVEAELDDSAQEEVAIGDLGYWPAGNAFCIFFGPTPMSREGRIIPASAVNVVGKVTDDATQLTSVAGESLIEIIPAPD